MASTWALRCSIALILFVVVAAVVAPATIYRGKRIAGLTKAPPAVDSADAGAVAKKPDRSDAELPVKSEVVAASVVDDDTGNAFKTPLARGLSGLLQATEAVVPEAGEQGLGEQVQRADDFLYEVKQQNRNAIRQANRQVRLRRTSPDLVLITIPGLTCNHLATFDRENAVPAIDAIAYGSVRQEIAANQILARQTLVTGRASDKRLRSDASLAASLYDSGYDTAVIGDCSFWNITSGGELRVTRWVGFRDEKKATQAFPDVIWSNGVALKLVANAGGEQGQPVDQLLEAEAMAFLRQPANRPQALILSLPPATTEKDLAKAGDTIGRLADHLAGTRRGRDTLLVIAGLPEKDAAPGNGNYPLIVTWPTRLKPGRVEATTAGFDDIPTTLLDLLSAQRRPRNLTGRSLRQDWKNAAKQ